MSCWPCPANGPKIGPVSSCPPPRSASPTASAATQPPVAPSGCTGTTWAAVSPSPFRNKWQPGSPPPDAALALHDNPERVKAQGVSITPSCPKGYAAVPLADYEPGFWDGLLSAAWLPKPSLVVAAAQDHGHHPEGNRVGRFNLWRALLTETQGDPARWLYDTSPAPCTRLNALQQCTGGPVADTATAAVLGALAAQLGTALFTGLLLGIVITRNVIEFVRVPFERGKA